MAHHIPIPVEVKVALVDRHFGKFHIFPEAIYGQEGLEVVSWTVVDDEDNYRERYDLLLTSVISRKILHEVCRLTFENEICPSVNLKVSIGEEKRSYPMRAVETDQEIVEYEISIEGEWMRLTNVFVGDVLDDDFLLFAELEVRPSIDFGHAESIYQEMS